MHRVTLNNNTGWDPSFAQHSSRAACFSQSVEYINYLPRKVGYVNRDGIRVYPDYRPSSNGNNYFLIRVEQRYTEMDKSRIIQQWRAGDINNSSLAAIVEKQWISNHPNNLVNLLRFEYKVTEPMLTANKNCVYLDEVDTVIVYDTACSDNRVFVHPYSREGYLFRNASMMAGTLSSSATAYSGNDFIFHVRIIDNAKNIGDKWVSFGGMVSKIKAMEDPELTDGVYVVHSEPTDSNNSSTVVITEMYEPSKVPYFDLYPSFSSAKNSPDLQVLHKEKMHRMEAESRVAEAQLKLDKAKQEAENHLTAKERDEAKHRADMAKYEVDMAKLKSEKEKLVEEIRLYDVKIKSERQKLENEILLLRRKNTSELLKYVPLAISIITAGLKLKKK